MSSRYQYTSMDRIFSKFDRDVSSEFNEDDIIEWTGEALEFMSCVKSYEERVCFKIVENYQCSIPKWNHGIIQIARDNQVSTLGQAVFFTKTVQEQLGQVIVLTDDGETVTVNNSGQLAESQTNDITLNVTYKGWIESPYYKNRFTPVRLKESSFFNSIVCQEKDDVVPYNVGVDRDEYTIINGDNLRFSFKEGLVGIAHLRQQLDDSTGYPMIPDHISITTAIVWYCKLKRAEKDFDNGRQGAQGRMTYAKDRWEHYCCQGAAVDMMP